jgi:hypothetical protein
MLGFRGRCYDLGTMLGFRGRCYDLGDDAMI